VGTQRLARNTVEILHETSHALFIDRPEQFNRVLEEFLASLPE